MEKNINGKSEKDDHGTKSRRYCIKARHLQAASMFICILVLFISRSCLSVAVLAMTDARRKNDTNVQIFEWDKRTQGIILSSFFWGYTIMQIPGGMLSKRFGGKLILLVALISNGCLCIIIPLLATSGGWQLLCAARAVMGLTQACLFPSSHTLIGRWFPAHEHTMYTGLIYGAVQLGTIIANPISGILAETKIGWKLIYYAVGGLIFLAAVFWATFAASTPGEHRLITAEEKEFIERDKNIGDQEVPPVPWVHILKTKAFWPILISQIAFNCSFNLFFVDLPTYLEKGLHISLKKSAMLSALPFLGMWLGSTGASTLSGFIVNRGLLSLSVSRKIFNSLSLYGVAIFLVVLSFLGPGSQSWAIVVLFAVLYCCGGAMGGFMVNMLDLSPNFAGVILGITNTAGNIGVVLTPVITSIILRNDPADISRWHIVFFATAALDVIANTAYLVFSSTDRQPWDDPAFMDKRKSCEEELKPVLNGFDKNGAPEECNTKV